MLSCHNKLLTRLLKTFRQPTTDSALLRAQQVGVVPSTSCPTETRDDFCVSHEYEEYYELESERLKSSGLQSMVNKTSVVDDDRFLMIGTIKWSNQDDHHVICQGNGLVVCIAILAKRPDNTPVALVRDMAFKFQQKCKVHAKRFYDGGQSIQQDLCFTLVFKDEGDVICVLLINKVLTSNNLNIGVLKTSQGKPHNFINDEVEKEWREWTALFDTTDYNLRTASIAI
ncbi:hypothetical protein T265_02297 [Opisthorchis viverrini]|uniref:Uncharacterized protein n=1 Tax=Opisthorchis viverrini TaxID=6198 RepID=A0A075A788_OPIVI|nr:hypothetical protein T265_02297 [Opisthorchis viverrini]KER31530.1 hypothetical protein T265_02297 [Opisthorchis viverrini]